MKSEISEGVWENGGGGGKGMEEEVEGRKENGAGGAGRGRLCVWAPLRSELRGVR